jgi:hypothetical protein
MALTGYFLLGQPGDSAGRQRLGLAGVVRFNGIAVNADDGCARWPSGSGRVVAGDGVGRPAGMRAGVWCWFEATGWESWIVVDVVRVDTGRVRAAAKKVGHVADDARGVAAGLTGADPLRHCGNDALGQGFAQAWAGGGDPSAAVAAADQLAESVTERQQRLEAVARVCEAADDAAGEAAADALAIVRAG